jgi:Flp pilus assembly protein TadG
MNRRSTIPPRANHRTRRGQALVEFALIAPVFFLVLFSIVEAGRFIFYYEMLNNATREGARYAIVHGEQSFKPTGPPHQPSGADVIAKVRQSAVGMAGPALTVTPSWWTDGTETTPGTNERGMTVKVTASYTYSSLIPLVPLPSVTVEAESTLVINN